ncbi:MAG: HAD family phosphatase, partial [Clostridiales bacterium]|nr:HAD family phosphatase [Clostridiales bacterium]
PAPDMYLNTARMLGVAPERCLVVEDSPLGLRSARLAGMRTCMVPDLRPYTDDLAPDCDWVLDSLQALPNLAAEVFPCPSR